jgi:hypothetical protein
MKFLKVIILAIFLVSVFPLGAFCSDEHQDTQTTHGHCVLMCHSVCVHATAPDQKSVSIPAIPVASSVLSAYNFPYQNPSLDSFKRPPIINS